MSQATEDSLLDQIAFQAQRDSILLDECSVTRSNLYIIVDNLNQDVTELRVAISAMKKEGSDNDKIQAALKLQLKEEHKATIRQKVYKYLVGAAGIGSTAAVLYLRR